LANPKIKPLWNRKPVEYLADPKGHVRGIVLEDTETGAREEISVKCVFVAIGHTPNTAPFRGKLDTDENGYLVQHDTVRTNVPGVFAAGDVADHVYRQAITAAGQGCAAAIEAERYLAARE
jgi:thioredoxin reductase (NADPH)